jgi:hypothetical protein
MFQFTTTTVINSLKDFTTGKDLVKFDNDVLYIKRHNPFKKDGIVNIFYTEAKAPVADKVVISGLAEQETDKRVELYIRSTGNADPSFANAMVFKGKPIFVEIPAGTKAADLVDTASKYFNFVFGGHAQLIASLEGTNLVITCTNGYQRITKAVVATRQDNGNFGNGESNSAVITTGNEGFGDYDHMIKDLRLPTSANLRWKRTMEDEMPIHGAMYNQYVLTYTVDRGILGMGAVGQKSFSTTTHVFWVNSDVDADFLAEVEKSGKVTKTDVDASNIVTD